MSLLDWIEQLKCQHEYKYEGEEQGYNFFDEKVTRRWFRCKKCLKQKFIDYEGW